MKKSIVFLAALILGGQSFGADMSGDALIRLFNANKIAHAEKKRQTDQADITLNFMNEMFGGRGICSTKATQEQLEEIVTNCIKAGIIDYFYSNVNKIIALKVTLANDLTDQQKLHIRLAAAFYFWGYQNGKSEFPDDAFHFADEQDKKTFKLKFEGILKDVGFMVTNAAGELEFTQSWNDFKRQIGNLLSKQPIPDLIALNSHYGRCAAK